MPNYDYQCLNCGYTFEEFQKMTDDPLTECPECGGQLKRLIGAGMGPIFKGTGFYQTDYKNASAKKESKKKESPAKPESSSKTNKDQK